MEEKRPSLSSASLDLSLCTTHRRSSQCSAPFRTVDVWGGAVHIDGGDELLVTVLVFAEPSLGLAESTTIERA